MASIPITKVLVDTNERLCVIPEMPHENYFSQIYRDDTGVEWDREAQCLHTLIDEDLPHSKRFEIIFRAAQREYGDTLMIGGQTSWENVSPNVRSEIEAIFEGCNQ